MKLAQALAERADIQKRLGQLRERLQLNARVQQGEKPAEQPKELLAELDTLSARLEQLVAQINLANAKVTDGGETLTEMLARRDALTLKVDILRDFMLQASETVIRGTRSEVKIISTVDVAALRRQTDELSRELRELDLRIQSLNWSAEL